MANSLTRRIFLLADRLEPDRAAVWQWFHCTPIRVFDGQTALELMTAGEGWRVEAWLETVLLSEEDAAFPGPILFRFDGNQSSWLSL
ncbi:DUF2384 domain-containing protein [Dyella telluris]|uniref:DUF2384 domain-containing protein n=1 Tax=Dyella telluris TaxID=2763498 RepID=A0A7G8Q3I2_9GAMM|nr:DUF2384 domain-containing protein [Dyella telluris]